MQAVFKRRPEARCVKTCQEFVNAFNNDVVAALPAEELHAALGQAVGVLDATARYFTEPSDGFLGRFVPGALLPALPAHTVPVAGFLTSLLSNLRTTARIRADGRCGAGYVGAMARYFADRGFVDGVSAADYETLALVNGCAAAHFLALFARGGTDYGLVVQAVGGYCARLIQHDSVNIYLPNLQLLQKFYELGAVQNMLMLEAVRADRSMMFTQEHVFAEMYALGLQKLDYFGLKQEGRSDAEIQAYVSGLYHFVAQLNTQALARAVHFLNRKNIVCNEFFRHDYNMSGPTQVGDLVSHVR